ncbi:SDR family oxidoreductase [Gordonia sp. TBRC 11910]|uniref:SDR family oxidoreductase n=1 Tax=Gordonia asplenii TaxID=2725283 RepID=A0A848KVE8_9ACTN|nr:SDR family oxidoreductase [Gordonia asplenii]NMO02232.1 SDR family oxidoreductase [Gordonia asplenii]
MDKRFEGQTAIVTGGSLGLGRAIAERYSADGAQVVIIGRDAGRVEAAAAEITALGGATVVGLAGDVAQPETASRAVQAARELGGSIDILVNSAGFYDATPFLEQSVQEWNSVIGVLLTGPFLMSQAVCNAMIADGTRGAIINISSADAYVAEGGAYPAYGSAKGGLLTLTKYVAVEMAQHGIRCNSISPGYCDTPMVKSLGPIYDAMKTNFDRVPMKRLIEPSEIASVAAFLASNEASAITGADMLVDAGTLADGYIAPTLDLPDSAS